MPRPPEQPPRREQEPQPYYLAFSFPSKQAAEQPYLAVQETIHTMDCDLSAYRFLRQWQEPNSTPWYVLIIGEKPEPVVEQRITTALSINTLTSVGRASHLPIIWVRQAFKADLSDAFLWMRKTQTAVTIENTPGSQLLNDLERDPTDLEVVKKRYSAFFRTNLDELLQTLAADLLIIGGINTHACVRMAVIDAYQRDYEVVLALDCTDSYDEEHHHISLRYLTRGICSGKTNPDLFDLLTSNPALFFSDSMGLEAHDTQARSVG